MEFSINKKKALAIADYILGDRTHLPVSELLKILNCVED
jgi:hypothetical protein